MLATGAGYRTEMRIFSGSSDFRGFLNIAFKVISLKSVITSTFFYTFQRILSKAVLTPALIIKQ